MKLLKYDDFGIPEAEWEDAIKVVATIWETYGQDHSMEYVRRLPQKYPENSHFAIFIAFMLGYLYMTQYIIDHIDEM